MVERKVLCSGIVACEGKISGVVRVVKSMADFTDFQRGDLLVAEITDPSYVVLMTKAAAIITDHGGLTSHPAIVSREMGVPCVVGTNNGTKVLKDGMRVTVDAFKGVIYAEE